MAPGDYTRAAKVAKAAEDADYYLRVQLARDYARGHNIGARKCVSLKLFPGVSIQVLNNALHDNIKRLLGQRYATDVLTTGEE
jgi:hypothetical protein